VARARAGIAYLRVAVGGHPARPLVAYLGVSPQAVYQAVARGRKARAARERLLVDDNGCAWQRILLSVSTPTPFALVAMGYLPGPPCRILLSSRSASPWRVRHEVMTRAAHAITAVTSSVCEG
jgi:hypothetical protein